MCWLGFYSLSIGDSSGHEDKGDELIAIVLTRHLSVATRTRAMSSSPVSSSVELVNFLFSEHRGFQSRGAARGELDGSSAMVE